MFLKDSDLVIRDAVFDDIDKLCEWWADGKVMAHAGFPNGVETDRELLKGKIANGSDLTGRRLIIEIDGKRVGEMSYSMTGDQAAFMSSESTGEDNSDAHSTKRAEIGIKICDFDYQERGYGTRALKLLIGALFELGAEKIYLSTNLNNKRAQHVYEKIGFKKVRVNTDSWKDQLGIPQSSVDYEMFREPFRE